ETIAISADLFVRTLALRSAFFAATVIAAGFGTTALAAHEAAFTIFLFLAFGLDALAIAAQSMVGLRVGAGDKVGVRAVTGRLRWWALAFGTATMVLLGALHAPIAHALVPDPAVADQLATLLLVVA